MEQEARSHPGAHQKPLPSLEDLAPEGIKHGYQLISGRDSPVVEKLLHAL